MKKTFEVVLKGMTSTNKEKSPIFSYKGTSSTIKKTKEDQEVDLTSQENIDIYKDTIKDSLNTRRKLQSSNTKEDH